MRHIKLAGQWVVFGVGGLIIMSIALFLDVLQHFENQKERKIAADAGLRQSNG